MEIQVELEEDQIQTKQDETTKSNDVLKQIINLVSILTDFISIADYVNSFPNNSNVHLGFQQMCPQIENLDQYQLIVSLQIWVNSLENINKFKIY